MNINEHSQAWVKRLAATLVVCSTVMVTTHTAWAAAPVLQDDSFTGIEDESLTGKLLDNDSDPDGDGLSVVANTEPGNGTLTVNAGGTFNFVPNPDFNGQLGFSYTVREISAACNGTSPPADCEVSADVILIVASVNDAPTLENPVGDRSGLEDAFSVVAELGEVFADVDVLTDGQMLTYSVVSISDPTLFSTTSLSPGGRLELLLTQDANGSATVVVQADDGIEQITDSFLVGVAAVNDVPIARDDFVSMPEDGGVLLIDVLANDYLAEGPAIIEPLPGGGASDSTDNFVVLDPTGNPVAGTNGSVQIVNGQIQYLPKPDFHGMDTFSYAIRDSSGGSDGLGDVSATATVHVTVDAVNDPPTAREQVEFGMLQDTTLQVGAGQGLLNFVYDVESSRLDSSGNPVGAGAYSAVLTTPPSSGAVSLNSDGSFTYTPTAGFLGGVEFGYQISDGGAQTTTDLRVRILVRPALAAPGIPNPGEVSLPFNLAESPLEQTTGVKPNVLLMMDDSGSMDWHISTASNSSDAVVQLSNEPIAIGQATATNYHYLWPLQDNTYGPSSLVGRILPTEAALALEPATAGNGFGAWRARHHQFNVLYYNPSVQYQPWAGFDRLNQPFDAAIPQAVRLDPIDPSATINLTIPLSYLAQRVPAWGTGGGTVDVSVTGEYIPRYYTSSANAPLASDAQHTEIRIEAGQGPLAGDSFPGGVNRTDCANANACSLGEELQNFANWFQYHRKREYVAKAGVGRVVQSVSGLRVGLETINQTASAEVADMDDSLAEGNKKALLDSLYSINSANGTPLRDALERAGEIYSCNGPGVCPVLPNPAGTCQQNFTLLFSDGFWNAEEGVTSNTDADGSGPFDGGRYADSVANTLADTAMFYYETDLQPGLADRVPPSQRDLQGVPEGTFSDGERLHQHMKTFAIAFGINGSIDASSIPSDPETPFNWPDPGLSDQNKVDDMLHATVNGRGQYLSAVDPAQLQRSIEDAFIEFGDAQSSLSAAAFNSTSLRQGTFLFRGFFDLSDNTGDLTATIVNEDGTLEATPVWSAARELAPDRATAAGRRIVTYDGVNRVGRTFLPGQLTPEQQLLLNPAQINWMRGDQANEVPTGALRERDAQRLLGDIVNSSPIFVGTPRGLNRDQAPYPQSDLYSEFIDDQSNRDGMVYVGANDGMLHGFDALTGVERFAFVPNKLIDVNARFRSAADLLTSPVYSHRYFVDLTPRLNDVYMRASASSSSKSWNTVLVGGLGAGGKGLFALNVTDPDAQFSSNVAATRSVLWEFTDEDDTYPRNLDGSFLGGSENAIRDPDGQPVKDLGYSLSLPTLAMSNRSDGQGSNDWIAVFGNGPNSTAGIAKLFTLFVDEGFDGWSDGDFVKVSTGRGVPESAPAELVGFPNGLGTPALIDEDRNGTVDLVYAGDRLGNLYRFDLRDSNPSNWESVLLFTAINDDGLRQPILSQPSVIPHPTQPGFLVMFGTGSYLTENDGSNMDIQSIYGIWDDGRIASPPTALSGARDSRLVEQVITNVVDDTVTPAQTRRLVSRNEVTYSQDGGSPGTYGWYIDLDLPRATQTTGGNANGDNTGNAPPGAQFPGERAIRNFIIRNGSVVTPTVLPSTGESACFGPRAGAILVFDALTGGDARSPLLDFNFDNVVDEADLVSIGEEAFSAGLLLDVGQLDGPLVDLATVGAVGDTDFLFVSGGNESTAIRIADVNDSRTGRLSWQEVEDN